MPDYSRRKPDIDYFDWLVISRSRNQSASLKLYKIVKKHNVRIKESPELTDLIQALVSVSFSLWRAVFLSDVTPEHQAALEDAEHFLENLIQNNAVAYPQDRNARYWSFRYYVSNARDRLSRIADKVEPKILQPLVGNGKTAEDWWDLHQDALEIAIGNLDKVLEAGVQLKVFKPSAV
jgi:hypothetical protein